MNKRVLIVASTMEHIENFHLPYIDGLKAADADVFTMAAGRGNRGKKPDFQIPFEKKIFSKENFKLVEKIKFILEKHNFDIVFLNTTLASFFVRLAIKKLKYKPKVVNIVHGYLFGKSTKGYRNFLFRNAEKYVRDVTDDIIVMNKEDYDIATKYKLAKGSIQKINGIGFDRERRITNRPEYTAKEKGQPYELTFVGELSERKNQRALINLVKRLTIRGINVHLNLIGKGVLDRELKILAEVQGVKKNVSFIGYDRNIQKYLDKTDFYVSASQIEGMPFSILEAMKAGCVVICANVKGCNDLIEEGQNGFLYEFNNLEQLTDKIIKIKDDMKLLNEVSKNAKKTVEKYDFGAVYIKNLQLFLRMVMESKW